MPYRLDRLDLRSNSPGTTRRLLVHRFGTAGARPRIYLQAGLHANEMPGMVVLDHLLRLLRAADAAGEIRGEVVVVPAANPIGLGDVVLGNHLGRHALASGANFNRGFLDLAPLVAPALEGRLRGDAAADTALIRDEMARVLAARQPRTEIEHLRLTLLGLAIGADLVFDLHCEEDALFAAVLAPWTVGAAAELVGDVAPELVFHADYPPLFDTACSRPWADLARHFAGRHAIPQGCLSATLELRGTGHLDDAQAAADAAGLLRALRRHGALSGEAGPLPPLRSAPMRFEGVEFVRAPAPGVVVYKRQLGEAVKTGDLLAEIVLPQAETIGESRVPVRSGTDGVVFCRRHTLLVQPDDVVAKVAGPVPLADPKHY